MNCNYTLSTTLDLYFKQYGFVDVCAVRSGNTTRYYFNDYSKDTKELVIDTNSNYSLSNVANVNFNGVVYQYRDFSTVGVVLMTCFLFLIICDKLYSWVTGIERKV